MPTYRSLRGVRVQLDRLPSLHHRRSAVHHRDRRVSRRVKQWQSGTNVWTTGVPMGHGRCGHGIATNHRSTAASTSSAARGTSSARHPRHHRILEVGRLVVDAGRSDHAAPALLRRGRHGPDGRVWVMGGEDGTIAASNYVDAYNPATGRWDTVAQLGTSRTRAAAVVGPDGRIYVMGGQQPAGRPRAGPAAQRARGVRSHLHPLAYARARSARRSRSPAATSRDANVTVSVNCEPRQSAAASRPRHRTPRASCRRRFTLPASFELEYRLPGAADGRPQPIPGHGHRRLHLDPVARLSFPRPIPRAPSDFPDGAAANVPEFATARAWHGRRNCACVMRTLLLSSPLAWLPCRTPPTRAPAAASRRPTRASPSCRPASASRSPWPTAGDRAHPDSVPGHRHRLRLAAAAAVGADARPRHRRALHAAHVEDAAAVQAQPRLRGQLLVRPVARRRLRRRGGSPARRQRRRRLGRRGDSAAARRSSTRTRSAPTTTPSSRPTPRTRCCSGSPTTTTSSPPGTDDAVGAVHPPRQLTSSRSS